MHFKNVDFSFNGGSLTSNRRLADIVVRTVGNKSDLQNFKLFIDIVYRRWIDQHVDQQLLSLSN